MQPVVQQSNLIKKFIQLTENIYKLQRPFNIQDTSREKNRAGQLCYCTDFLKQVFEWILNSRNATSEFP